MGSCLLGTWRRQQHPTPVLLPGKSHGQRSLVGYSPWGCKESDTSLKSMKGDFVSSVLSQTPPIVLMYMAGAQKTFAEG